MNMTQNVYVNVLSSMYLILLTNMCSHAHLPNFVVAVMFGLWAVWAKQRQMPIGSYRNTNKMYKQAHTFLWAPWKSGINYVQGCTVLSVIYVNHQIIPMGFEHTYVQCSFE